MTIIENGIRYTVLDNQREVLVGDRSRSPGNSIDTSTFNNEYVFIPECVQNKKVTRVAYLAFQKNQQIKKISFPCTIQVLEQDGCSHMPILEEIAFRGNSQLRVLERGVFYNDKSLQNLILPPLVQSIGIYCFGITNIQNLVYCGRYEFNDKIIFRDDSHEQYSNPSLILVPINYVPTKFGDVDVQKQVYPCAYLNSMKCCGHTQPKTEKISISVLFVLFFHIE